MQKDLFSLSPHYLFLSILVMKLAKLSLVGAWEILYITQIHTNTLWWLVEKSGIFNSNMQPLRLTFATPEAIEYPIIFKTGDDLRQDQLVIQIITLMDKLLQKENLDLKLTPYKVLATGPDHGLMQFVPSKSLAAVLNDHQNNVLSFFRQYHPDPGPDGIYGIDSLVMETYIRSCGKLDCSPGNNDLQFMVF